MKTLHNYLVQLNIHLINQRLKQRSLDKFLCKKIHYWIHTFFKTNTCNACSKELLFSLPRSSIGNAQGHLDHSKLQVYLINLFWIPPPPQIITSSIGIADHFTTCARIFDTDVVTGDEDASLYCLVPRVSESTTALFSMFLVGRTTDVAHQRICSKIKD